MIQANELRIGNKVEYYNDGTLFDVIGVDILGISVKNEEQETWIEYDCFSGIAITEEWLLMFGFEEGEQKRGYFPPKFLKKYTPVLVENKFQVEFIDEHILMWLEGNTNVHMRYVHQLQNLYFSLTGEELELKN